MANTNLTKFNGGYITQEYVDELLASGDFVLKNDELIVKSQSAFADLPKVVPLNTTIDFDEPNSLISAEGPDPVNLTDALAQGNSLTRSIGNDPVNANDSAPRNMTDAELDDYFTKNEQLNEIAVTYGVDPESEQAQLLWEQDYGEEEILETNIERGFRSTDFRDQQQIRNAIEKTDWRFRVRLSPFSDYLYNHPNAGAGILRPLQATGGVIFPYTPSITVENQANYESYDLTHSNHRGYFYKGSFTGNIVVNATFTAQDTAEAEYLLAVITFFKAATKMFYGQDKGRRGTPPPLLYMTGMGEYAFNEHPCVLTTFNIEYPDDVDYIRTHVGPQTNDKWTGRMNSPSGHQSWSGRISRLISSGLSGQGFDLKGAFAGTFGIPELDISPGPSGTGSSFKGRETYVPTEIKLNLIFLPIQTRDQVSNTFSLEKYASGELIKKGYW